MPTIHNYRSTSLIAAAMALGGLYAGDFPIGGDFPISGNKSNPPKTPALSRDDEWYIARAEAKRKRKGWKK
jgi:hypothetical protein